jgi:hypothetical protein
MAALRQHKALLAKLERRRWIEVRLNRCSEITIVAVSIFLFIIALHQIAGAYSLPKATERIARLDELSKIATTLSAIFIAATFVVTGHKYREEASLRRKLEGNEFLVSIILGRVTDYRMRLRNKVDPYGTSGRGAVSYERSVSAGLLRPHGRDEILIKSFLNHLEYMCLAIHEGIIDEGFVKDSQENILFLYWKWFYPYITEMRASYYKEAWMGIDYMVYRWRRKEAEDVVLKHASS